MTEAVPRRRVSARLIRDAAEMEAILTIRRRVFAQEQGVATGTGTDAQDRGAYHVVGLVGDQIVGAGRLVIIGGEGQIAWVAVLPAYRRLGVGRAIMDELLLQADWAGLEVVMLNAQTHARRFYEHLGFVAAGTPFIMSGIEHQVMSRRRPD
jgi:predicted GNAT family N-acyltransferase